MYVVITAAISEDFDSTGNPLSIRIILLEVPGIKHQEPADAHLGIQGFGTKYNKGYKDDDKDVTK
jgi:hypothetical protein